MAADMLGASPQQVLLVGIVGESCEPGMPLTDNVRQSAQSAVGIIVQELRRLGYSFQKKSTPDLPGIWWEDHSPASAADPLT